jgi:hypothetical protein
MTDTAGVHGIAGDRRSSIWRRIADSILLRFHTGAKLERAAEALYYASKRPYGPIPWDCLNLDVQNHYLDLAVICIDAYSTAPDREKTSQTQTIP